MCLRFWCVLLLLLLPLSAQRRADRGKLHERVLAIVPITGAGTAADPRRPAYAPVKPSRTGIIGYTAQISDDGKLALVEFVALNRSVLAPILADRSVKTFEKGKAKKNDIETEFRKHKANFKFENFRVSLP